MRNQSVPFLLSIATASITVCALGVSIGWAHKGAKGVVMERMMSMKSMGDGMKVLSQMVTGKVAFDAAQVTSIAKSLKQHAAKIPEQFPKGSLQKPTEALPVIWQKWDDFKEQSGNLEMLAGELEIAAASGKPASLVVFAKIGKSCSACHQDFRLKKE